MMQYLVDAYNLLFRIRKKTKNLQETRRRLIEELNEKAHSLRLNITLVFDGADEHIPYALRSHFDAIALVYTPQGQTADEYIFQEVSESLHPKALTVVSNDNELIRKCSSLKAKTQTIHAFLSLLYKKETKQRKAQSHGATYQDSSYEINRLLTIFEKKLRHPDEEG